MAKVHEEPLRIAMVSTPYVAVPPARYGGTELVVSELVKGLGELGHEVVLFATGDSRPPCELRSLFARPRWPPHMLTDLAHASWAALEIRAASERFDVVHAHLPSFLAFAGLLGDTPVVYTIHHDRDEALSSYYGLQDEAIEYVAISARQRSLHGDLANCRVVHHGIDPSLYRVRERGQGYLAFLGRLSHVKGPDLAIEVAGLAGRELRIGGNAHSVDGTFFDEILSPMLKAPHVRHLGELSHRPKVELLSGADALLFPIRWEEPFGLVMIEAMMCGCPVVAFPGGAVAEIVEHGLTGFLAADVEDMARLVRDEVPRLDRMRVRRRAEERFSTAKMVDGYTGIYRRLSSERDPWLTRRLARPVTSPAWEGLGR